MVLLYMKNPMCLKKNQKEKNIFGAVNTDKFSLINKKLY